MYQILYINPQESQESQDALADSALCMLHDMSEACPLQSAIEFADIATLEIVTMYLERMHSATTHVCRDVTGRTIIVYQAVQGQYDVMPGHGLAMRFTPA